MDSFRSDKVDSEGLDAVRRRVWSIIDSLPQREAIREADARAWVDAVVSTHAEAAIWHATRLGGFGGSEIGVLVRNFFGQRADHGSSAHDIVEAKLMRRAPLEETSVLRRGHDNEPLHAQHFYSKWGAVRDEAAYESLKNAKGRAPWMRYSPDDVVRMPFRSVMVDGALVLKHDPKADALWLIDYKAPTNVDVSDVVSLQYAAQLHQGAILCAEQSMRIDGMMLSQFDWARWSLKDDVVSWDPDLGANIIRAGNHYWDYVLRAEIPPYVVRPQWDGAKEYVEAMAHHAKTYAALHALSDAAKQQAEVIRSVLLAPLSGSRIGGAKIDYTDPVDGQRLLSMTVNKVLDKQLVQKLFTPEQLEACAKKASEYDSEAMARRLKELGQDLSAFRKYALDTDKVISLAAQLQMDVDQLVNEQPVFRVASHVKEMMKQYVEQSYPLPSTANDMQSESTERAGESDC